MPEAVVPDTQPGRPAPAVFVAGDNPAGKAETQLARLHVHNAAPALRKPVRQLLIGRLVGKLQYLPDILQKIGSDHTSTP